MNKSNIWDKLPLETQSPNLLKELKNQAQLLADKTNGILYAEVNPIGGSNERTLEPGIVYNFQIYAPYLGNIRTLLFRVVDEGAKYIIVNKINNAPNKEVKSIDDLIENIENIISSGKATALISNLYTSSIEVKK